MREPRDPVPSPPEGYLPAIAFTYPITRLHMAALVLLVLSVPFWLAVSWLLHGRPAGGSFSVDLLGVGAMLLASVLVIVVHEAAHGLVAALLGYRVSFGVAPALGAAYAACFGQFQKRWHNLLVALAPLALLTPLLVPLLGPVHPALVAGAVAALVCNTSGAVGDLYIIWRLLRMPRGTLLYDRSPEEMYLFLPVAARPGSGQ